MPSVDLVHRSHIWYVHPYAGGPGVGRYDRPFHLSKEWKKLGQQSVVLTTSDHHQMDRPRAPGGDLIGGVMYEFLPATSYVGNGIRRILNMFLFSANLWRHRWRLASKYGIPKVIICSSPHPYAFLVCERLAKTFECGCVFEVRDLWPLSIIELAGVKPWHPLVYITGWIEKRAYTKSDAVVSLLPNTIDHMSSKGLDRKKWHYIPNGVSIDREILNNVQDSAVGPVFDRVRLWHAQNLFVMAYAGALGRPNHLETLIEAVVLQKKAGSRARVLIVGRGENEKRILDLILRHELQDYVAVFPQIPKRDVQLLLGQIDLGYISLRPENIFRFGISPNKLYDYMLAGLPVLFAVRAGNDPVKEARCGITVDPGSPSEISAAMTQFLEMGRTGRQVLGVNGREWVERNHAYQCLALRYLKVIEGGEKTF